MISFLKMAEEEFFRAVPEEEKSGTRVAGLTLEVGEMTGVLPAYLEKYFPEAARGTRFEESTLKVIPVPVEAECTACGTSYHPGKENDYRCPSCQSTAAKIIHGRELSLKELLLKEAADRDDS